MRSFAVNSHLGTFAGRSGILLLLVLPVAGCHSAFMMATVVNRSSQPVRLVEVDYPSASFGTERLAPGATFKTRFKIQGSGATTVSWTDALEKEHTSPGPSLSEGQEGELTVVIGPETATWNRNVRR